MTQNRSDSILKKSLTDRFQESKLTVAVERKKKKKKNTTRQNYRNPSHRNKIKRHKKQQKQ